MNRGWYIVHTQSGYEDRVKRLLDQKVDSLNLRAKVFNILIPTEDVVEIKRNKKMVKKRKFFPGYVLADMIVDNETYWLVKGVGGVTGFLGEPKPVPLPPEEIQGILDLTSSNVGGKPK